MWFGFLKKNNNIEITTVFAARRELFKSTVRWAIVGSFAGTVGMLWKRNGITLNRQTCSDTEGRMGCRDCSIFARCGHPRALSVKQFLEKQG